MVTGDGRSELCERTAAGLDPQAPARCVRPSHLRIVDNHGFEGSCRQLPQDLVVWSRQGDKRATCRVPEAQ